MALDWHKLGIPRRDPFGPGGLTPNELLALATYNAEVGRGIVHTDEYDDRMRELQEQFDDSNRPQSAREGSQDPAPSP
jgi:hypothetical protein